VSVVPVAVNERAPTNALVLPNRPRANIRSTAAAMVPLLTGLFNAPPIAQDRETAL